MKNPPFRYNLLTVCIIGAMQPSVAYAADDTPIQEPYFELEKIIVEAPKDTSEQQTSKIVKTAEDLSRQMVSDSRDLVRYETGVTVVEAGRFGSSGYAIRGVDENRVAINIDGLRQSETLSSQGFKELFEGYGNFNNTRNSVEMENVRTATIQKGSDSVNSGSGALGGAVSFETKEIDDFLYEKDWHVGYKTGYSTADNQKLDSVSLAGRYKGFDALVIKTRRDGHELENYFYDIYNTKEEDLEAVGETREKTDPYDIVKDSTLIKLGYEPNLDHRFSVMYDDSKINSDGKDLSYILQGGQFSNQFTKGERENHDKSHRRNVQFAYENRSLTPFWDNFKVSYSNQKVVNTARSDEFCDGPKCVGVNNPHNLQLGVKDGANAILKDGIDSMQVEYDYGVTYKDSDGNVLNDVSDIPVENVYIDCSIVNCSQDFLVSAIWDKDWNPVYEFQKRQIKIKEFNGKQYGYIEPEKNGNKSEALRFVVPKSKGRTDSIYNDRDLNTDTKQVNFDFDKNFSFGRINNDLTYGGLYSKTNKSMVNEEGFGGKNPQWWAELFVPKEKDSDNPRPNYGYSYVGDYLKQNSTGTYSYLVPVETKNTAFYLGDKINFTDWLNIDLNYRYDKIKHTPSYDENVPIPKGMIAGIFVPLPGNAYGENAECGYNTDCMNNNVSQNLALMLQDKEYKHHSYSVGVSIDPLSWLRVQAKYANGFRAPTSDEMFMTFKHPSFSITPNVDLKPEVAKTKELALTWHKNQNFLTVSGFRTDYNDFIDLVYAGARPVDVGSSLRYPFYKNINRESAKVDGIEINSRLNLGDIYSPLDGFRLGYKLTHQKGRIRGIDTSNNEFDNTNNISDEVVELPMNAIQPTTMVYNLGYSSPDDKYGVDLFVTHADEKKRSDTYNMYWRSQQGSLVQGQPVTDNTLAYRNNSYTTLDAVFYARPTKNLTLTAGVYNITDKEYITWDSARSIRAIGTINRIDQNTGEGLKRFYAPGRNFKISAEFVF